MYDDVKSTRLTASGSVFGGPARVKGIYFLAGGTAGTIVIRDGGASGTVLATIDTPADTSGTRYIPLPGMGLRCETSAYCEFDQAAGVTVFYA